MIPVKAKQLGQKWTQWCQNLIAWITNCSILESLCEVFLKWLLPKKWWFMVVTGFSGWIFLEFWLSRFSRLKTKNCNHSMNYVKSLGYDRWLICKQPRQESGLCCFHSQVICRSVSPKFMELCMETPCLCPLEGHKHGGHKVKETSVTEVCYWNEKLCSRSPTYASFSASTV